MSEIEEVTTAETSLLETLRALEQEWQSDNWPHTTEVRPRSYYAVAAERIEQLESALTSARSEIEELKRENFALAAHQCRSGSGDESGNFHCCCSPDNKVALAIGRAVMRLQSSGKWWVIGKGKTRPAEPLYGCLLQEAEIDGAQISKAEGPELLLTIERALDQTEDA